MAWLEAHQELRDHPKIKRAARMLGINRPQMIGHMLCLWWWCLDYAEDGDLTDFDRADIADAADWQGEPDDFVEALLNCGPADRPGFLTNGDGIKVNDWDEYGGKYIAKRNQSRDRQRTFRNRNTPRNTDKTDDNALVTRDNSVSNSAREDKIREDNRTEEKIPEAAAPSAKADTGASPGTLGEWHDLLRADTNKVAVLRRMFDKLYPDAVDIPDYSRLGKTAKQVGGAGRLAELMWTNSAKPPSGDVMAYLVRVSKNGTGRNGNDPKRRGETLTDYEALKAHYVPRHLEDLVEY